MRRRWLLALLLPVAAVTASRALAPRGVQAPRPPPLVRDASPPRAAPSPAPEQVAPPAAAARVARAEDPRRSVARELRASSPIGALVQQAMAQPGDSDPRLLDLLRVTGLAPGALAAAGATVDPWLGLGLVDLQRQVARRCAVAGEEPTSCWAPALAAEDGLRSGLVDDDAVAALERFRAADELGARP